jgi:hypothetical protein
MCARQSPVAFVCAAQISSSPTKFTPESRKTGDMNINDFNVGRICGPTNNYRRVYGSTYNFLVIDPQNGAICPPERRFPTRVGRKRASSARLTFCGSSTLQVDSTGSSSKRSNRKVSTVSQGTIFLPESKLLAPSHMVLSAASAAVRHSLVFTVFHHSSSNSEVIGLKVYIGTFTSRNAGM